MNNSASTSSKTAMGDTRSSHNHKRNLKTLKDNEVLDNTRNLDIICSTLNSGEGAEAVNAEVNCLKSYTSS